ncbi:hypothetical protein GX586_06240, partial [bacterium]|nr:hypothetical protein [bacterium]
TNYVSLTGLHIAPFTSWVNAATNIQAAVDAANAGNLVLVAAGEYRGEPVEISGSMVVIEKGITLESVDGPAATTINAIGWHKRNIYMSHPDAVVRGFFLAGGYARTNMGPQTYPVSYGGGVFIKGGGLVDACIIDYARAGLAAGSAYLEGGGELRDCLIMAGSAPWCGGVYCSNGGSIVNCTIVQCRTLSTNFAGGVWCVNGGTVVNSIIFSNVNEAGSADDVHNEGTGGTFLYSRVPAGIAGTGVITNDPMFTSPQSANYRLAPGSPCDGSGTNLPWMDTATDLDGGARVQKGTVDMGPYETPGVYYVSTNGAHISPFITWANAATTIQAAVSAAFPDTIVLVSNGVYASADGVGIGTNITVRSIAGPADTIIDGQNLRRCAGLRHSAAVLDGFTCVRGMSTDNNGGAIGIENGTVRNCIIRDSFSAMLGGGVSIGPGTLENCVVRDNHAAWGGGGVFVMGPALLRNCDIMLNATPAAASPFGTFGGGGVFLVSGGVIENCGIAQNWSANDGGGIYYTDLFGPVTAVVRNSIIAWNSAVSNGNNYIGARLSFLSSCTTPAVPPGADEGGNISGDPLFASAPLGVLRLAPGSPCINAASNLAWMAGTYDLDGGARVVGPAPDMGAHELQAVYHVAPSGAHVPPFSSWANASTTIIAAAGIAQDGSVVLVNTGVYAATVELAVTNAILVTTVGGPDVTAVDGGGVMRAFHLMAPAAVVDGFTVRNCNAPAGEAGPLGGGVALRYGILQNCLVTNNVAAALGGGIFFEISDSSPGLGIAYQCRITGNKAFGGGGGGAIMIAGGTLLNCLIDGNLQTGSFSGVSGGAGVICVGGGTIINCTIAGNVASNSGGGVFYTPFPPVFTNAATICNSIVYGNTAVDGNANYGALAPLLYWQNSCTMPEVPPATDLGGIIATNPLYADAPNGNYRPLLGSPCIATGSNMLWMISGADLDGHGRIFGASVDMGAYEFVPEPCFLALGVFAAVSFLRGRRAQET